MLSPDTIARYNDALPADEPIPTNLFWSGIIHQTAASMARTMVEIVLSGQDPRSCSPDQIVNAIVEAGWADWRVTANELEEAHKAICDR